MDDERLAGHIAEWMTTLGVPAVVELRTGANDVIEHMRIETGKEPFDVMARELIAAAENDCAVEGKARTYVVMGINAEQERYPCPMRIRRRFDKSAGDIVNALQKQNAELHAALVKERKNSNDLLLKLCERLDSGNARLTEENHMHRGKASEVIDKLESLRSKALERQLVEEKHKADLEMKERLTDAFVPLALAIGSKMTGGKILPAPDMQQLALHEIAKSLNPTQLVSIQGILGLHWEEFRVMLDGILTNSVPVARFKEWAGRIPQEKIMAIVQSLNMGQAAALNELINGTSNGQAAERH